MNTNVKLKDVCTIKYGKDYKHLNKGKYPLFGSSGIFNYVDNFLYDKPSILIPRKGSLGNLFYYDKPFWSVDTMFWTIIHENCYPKYLYYYLKTKNLSALNVGSAVPSLTTQVLYDLDISLPIMSEQKAIADVLSSFDDKIELNNKIIKNLEEQAQSLYKHWFVDFEFPNEDGKPYKSSGGKFKESELGLIPEDWDCKNIGDVCTRLTKRVKDGKYEVLSAVNTGELVLSSDYFNKQVFSENISNYIIVPPLSFAYNPARANIGSIGMNKFNFDGCVSPIYIAVTFEKDYHWFWEILIKSEFFKEQIKTRSSGSVRQNFDFNSFSTIKIAYPKAEVIKNFNVYYDTFNKQLIKTKNENKKLEETRDYLLQKMMNGEIKVGN